MAVPRDPERENRVGAIMDWIRGWWGGVVVVLVIGGGGIVKDVAFWTTAFGVGFFK